MNPPPFLIEKNQYSGTFEGCPSNDGGAICSPAGKACEMIKPCSGLMVSPEPFGAGCFNGPADLKSLKPVARAGLYDEQEETDNTKK